MKCEQDKTVHCLQHHCFAPAQHCRLSQMFPSVFVDFITFVCVTRNPLFLISCWRGDCTLLISFYWFCFRGVWGASWSEEKSIFKCESDALRKKKWNGTKSTRSPHSEIRGCFYCSVGNFSSFSFSFSFLMKVSVLLESKNLIVNRVEKWITLKWHPHRPYRIMFHYCIKNIGNLLVDLLIKSTRNELRKVENSEQNRAVCSVYYVRTYSY